MGDFLRRHLSADHRAAARMLVYALVSGEAETWEAATLVWTLRLSPAEREALADAAAAAAGEDATPGAPFLSPEGEAAFWAGLASHRYLVATARAALAALPLRDRRRIIDDLRTQPEDQQDGRVRSSAA